MKVFMNNTRDLSKCLDLKADELRAWAGLFSIVDYDMAVPKASIIGKRCNIRTSTITTCLKAFMKNGFIVDAMEPTINPRYLSFDDLGVGSVPFMQENLKELSRNRSLHAEGLRLFYYLLGDLRRDSKIYDTNITAIASVLKSDRANTSRIVGLLKNDGMITSHMGERRKTPFGRKYFVVSKEVLGMSKRKQ